MHIADNIFVFHQSGMAYAKSQFHKLKAVKDEKVTEVVDLNQKVGMVCTTHHF